MSARFTARPRHLWGMQTILGYGGAIGQPLATALANHTTHVRCVARSPKTLPAGEGTHYEMVTADLLDLASAVRAVAGSRVVYMLVGLPYKTAVWRRDWPVLIANVIEACAAAGASLVFLDNVYAVDPAAYDGFSETAALRPPSSKGEVRRAVLEQLTNASVPVLIARAADFYGPGIENSLFRELIVKKLAAGSAAQWLGNADLPHSFTYTPDAGAALATLGNDPTAYGQTWNLPTSGEARTVREWTAAVARELDVAPKLQVVPRWLWRLLAYVSGDLRELYDVREQVLRPYVFSSAKFTRRYGTVATDPPTALAAILATERTAG